MPKLTSFVARMAPLALPLLVVACKSEMDHKQAEGDVRKMLTDKNVSVTDVSCPEHMEGKVGAKHTCTVKDEMGTQATVTITVTGKSGDQYQVEFDLVGKFENLQKLGDFMETALSKKAGTAIDVKCPGKNFFVKKGVKFACDATAGGQSKKMHFQFSDDDGNIEDVAD